MRVKSRCRIMPDFYPRAKPSCADEPGELADLVDDLIGGGLEPRGGSAGVRDGRAGDTLKSILVKMIQEAARCESVGGGLPAFSRRDAVIAESYLALGVKTTHFDGIERRLSVVEIGLVEAVVAGEGRFAKSAKSWVLCVGARLFFPPTASVHTPRQIVVLTVSRPFHHNHFFSRRAALLFRSRCSSCSRMPLLADSADFGALSQTAHKLGV